MAVFCAVGIDVSALSEHDRQEIEKFYDYCRRVAAAEQAGVPGEEAADAIYPDVYGEDRTPKTIP